MTNPAAILDVQSLTVAFRTREATTVAVRDVSFHVAPGETLALVGESGSGKSVSALATVGLAPDAADITGSVTFEGEEMVETMHLGKQSAYLIGRDKAVADIYLRHPSLSKQHAVLQYRVRTYVDPDRPFLVPKRAVLPYIMDLGSTNGTFLNGERLEGQRYYELREKDNLRFGESTREFVLLTDQSN